VNLHYDIINCCLGDDCYDYLPGNRCRLLRMYCDASERITDSCQRTCRKCRSCFVPRVPYQCEEGRSFILIVIINLSHFCSFCFYCFLFVCFFFNRVFSFSLHPFFFFLISSLGPSIKDVRTKSQKLDLFSHLVRKMSALAQPTLRCPCGHTISFKNSGVFCAKKCERPHLKTPSLSEKYPHWTNPFPLTADDFYGQPPSLFQ